MLICIPKFERNGVETLLVYSKAAAGCVVCKMVFLKTLEIPQETTWVGISFW